MDKVLEALKEASISIACCLDDVDDVSKKDLEHIQNQITIIENYLDPFVLTELEELVLESKPIGFDPDNGKPIFIKLMWSLYLNTDKGWQIEGTYNSKKESEYYLEEWQEEFPSCKFKIEENI